MSEPLRIDYMPEWDASLFNGAGGYIGEDENTYVMCSTEYDQIVVLPNRTYLVWDCKKFCPEAKARRRAAADELTRLTEEMGLE